MVSKYDSKISIVSTNNIPVSEVNLISLFIRCELAAGQAIDIHDGIDTSGFYIELATAQVYFII